MSKTGQPGFTFMVDQLFGDHDETLAAFQTALNHTISEVKLEDNEIRITLDNGRMILVVTDAGQSCCEERYITTDADLPSYIGKKILDFQQSDYKASEADYDVHDIQSFLVVTDEGKIDFVTHVVHNGYYGGFVIKAKLTGVDI